jgi:hypothetical protein
MTSTDQGTYSTALSTPKPRRKRRVFLWVFLAIQAIFVIWLISAGFSTDHAVTHCTGFDCKGATETGSAIGIGLVVAFWAFVDIIIGGGYAVFRLASRSR